MIILLILITSLLGCSCDIPNSPDEFRVLSYNVENLFDATLDGSEYPEYQTNWSERSYHQRLKSLSKTLLDSSLRYPDVIVLQEVENERVVGDLLSGYLAKKGYRSYAVASTPDSAISVGAISRHPIIHSAVHAVPGGRNILEVVVETPIEEIVIFVLHAKSQIGEFEETEAIRIEGAKSVKAAVGDYPNHALLVCGDFNQNPTAVYESGGVQTALVDVAHPSSSAYARGGSLLITGDEAELGPGVLYNPYLSEPPPPLGSYSYGGSWQQYDQILLSSALFDRRKWEYESFEIIRFEYLLHPDGTPKRWNLKTLNGYSDHLPVMVTLKLTPWEI